MGACRLLLLLACTGATPGTASPSETPVTTAPPPSTPASSPLTERRRVDLVVGEPVEIAEIGLQATLVSSRDALIRRPDGRRGHRVSGRLHLALSDEELDVDFVSGQGFEAFGYNMVVFGTGGWLELSVFPPGEAVTP